MHRVPEGSREMSATLLDYRSVDDQFKYRVTGRNYCGFLVEADGEEAALLDAYTPALPSKPDVVAFGDGQYAVNLKYARLLGLA